MSMPTYETVCVRCGHAMETHAGFNGCNMAACACRIFVHEPEPQHTCAGPAGDAKSEEVLEMVRAHYEGAYRERVREWLREQADGWGESGGNGMRWAADNLP